MRSISPFLLLPALAACAGGAPPASAPEATGHILVTGESLHVTTSAHQRTVAHEIPAPVEAVWAALPGVMAEMGLAGNPDDARRTVTAPARLVNRRLLEQPLPRFLDCGRGQFGTELAATNPVRLAVRTTVQPGEEGSRLETVVEAQARVGDGGAGEVLAPCRSNGRLEAAIAERVRARLAG